MTMIDSQIKIIENRISIILPTYNERDNIWILIPAISKTLKSYPSEIIVVDDNSDDGTYPVAKKISKKIDHVHVILRTKEKGLSSAVLHGMRFCQGEYIVVMDADLQHDEKYIPPMIQTIKASNADICVGSRSVAGGSYGAFSIWRIIISRIATGLANVFLPFGLKDPMSGFFIIRASHYRRIKTKIRPIGFKILLDILAAEGKTKIIEYPIIFRNRRHGKTKIGLRIILFFLYALIHYWLLNTQRKVRSR